ncbi:hypothetical protein [Amycolatopsis sp. cmx-4-54]|uniref:hypothetical protein n=1 Tax=Amycolatopsis sp. cmx-4-54 TaxID=2790936 RepID=UPI00397E5509
MTETRLHVEWLAEDGFIVVGTLDPHAALAAAVDDDDEMVIRYSAVEEAYYVPDEDPSRQAVAELSDAMHQWLQGAAPGLYRWLPASDEDRAEHDVTRWLSRADKAAADTFEGVLFP